MPPVVVRAELQADNALTGVKADASVICDILSMARYFFHLYGATTVRDSEAVELVSDREAWVQSVRSAATTLHGLASKISPGQPYRLECTKGDGQPVFNVAFEATRAG